MARPIAGYEFDLTSIGGSSDLTTLLANTKTEGTATLTINGASLPIGNSGATPPNSSSYIGGIYDWEVSWDWLFPAAPKVGYELFLTLGTNYDDRPKSFTINMAADEFDITEATDAGAAPIARSYMPGQWTHTFNFTCMVDDTQAMNVPTTPEGAAEAATFKFTDEGVSDDHKLTGNVIVDQFGLPISRQGLMLVTYGGTVDGDLTVVSPSNNTGFLPEGVIGIPDWENGSGVADVLLTGTLITGRTFAGNVFGRNHSITATLGEVLRGTTTARGIGPITFG